MHRYIFLLISICHFTLSYTQCDYSRIEYDNVSGKGILRTEPITIDLFETPMNGRLVLAYLLRAGNKYFIELEITEDSSSQDLEPICIENGNRLSFLLKNNSTLSLPHINERICGIKTYDQKSGYTTISNYGLFILTQQAFDLLMKSEILILKLAATNYNKEIVLKEELEESAENGSEFSSPSRFFIDNIDCLIDPKLK